MAARAVVLAAAVERVDEVAGCSLIATVRQSPVCAGLTQAASVIPVVEVERAESATVTMSFVPSKLRALPTRPLVTRVAPEMVPGFERPELSNATLPEVSSKLQAPTRPGSTGHTASV